MLSTILLYLIVGVIAGILAGLLGVGGGLVIVPMLTFAFTLQHFPPEHIHHLALGTSLASIMFTSVSSFMAHHKRGAVIWSLVIRITPGIIVGTFAGSWVASKLSTGTLQALFIMFLLYVGTQMLLDIKPKAQRELPNTGLTLTVGGIIGAVSSFVGIGGGSLSVPFMLFCNTPMAKAIGTSAAIGFPIAIAGAFGYIVNGWSAMPELPAYSLGYVSLPALAGIAIASTMTAPLGAKLAHSLPVKQLKMFFALLLYVMAFKMLYSLL